MINYAISKKLATHSRIPGGFTLIEPGEAWIIATPNPVPAGRGPGKTIVNWYTGDGSSAQVYVSIGGGPEKLFSAPSFSSRGAYK
jgi:hypothetical protein